MGRPVITDQLIDQVAILAKLDLSGQDRQAAKEDMGKILAYMDKLNELDTEGVEPMTHLFPLTNVFREDSVIETDGHEDTLANAPDRRGDYLAAPRTFQTGEEV